APRDRGNRVLRPAVTEQFKRPQLHDLLSQMAADVIGSLVNSPVSLSTKAQEVVVLADDLAGRPGEVDLADRHAPAEVVAMKPQVVGEFFTVAPHHPADAQRRKAELVT